ncbi:hypothetical protein Pst134EA_030535 [Puccinia striiformis f. sp. tritici]|uniref:hypothetical protein n=1 Tax=Puccinia striiformis f. sp. tritici TaxID=168172 RepID=UPI002008CF48|nr:hypothetical protein Pst134EA_030535 [Puccinia striiformis f. sp. tritici]KAH9446624.1 hypothetical protein Pst134EA_030535 [Puccinia striiformis f. sp. tritici]
MDRNPHRPKSVDSQWGAANASAPARPSNSDPTDEAARQPHNEKPPRRTVVGRLVVLARRHSS